MTWGLAYIDQFSSKLMLVVLMICIFICSRTIVYELMYICSINNVYYELKKASLKKIIKKSDLKKGVLLGTVSAS